MHATLTPRLFPFIAAEFDFPPSRVALTGEQMGWEDGCLCLLFCLLRSLRLAVFGVGNVRFSSFEFDLLACMEHVWTVDRRGDGFDELEWSWLSSNFEVTS